VIGVPDPKWIERPLALLVAKPGQEVSEAQIRTQLSFAAKGIIPRYSVPEQIVFVEALPNTSVGKLRQESDARTVRNKGVKTRKCSNCLVCANRPEMQTSIATLG
jgi:acyl-CoA synthetase (AMP-forming)/AMP-acid ligase II